MMSPLHMLIVSTCWFPGHSPEVETPLRQTQEVQVRGGGVDGPIGECVTDAQRRVISRQIRTNERIIQVLGLAPTYLSSASIPAGAIAPTTPTAAVEFAWPINAVGSASLDYGVHGISNFVDADKLSGQKLDYNCGGRTYDQHHGVDIFSWPYAWNRFESDEIKIVAAAAGLIVLKQGGFFDKSCGPSSLPWNAVYVRHIDGSVAWYGHMKSGSLTSKTVGQTVAVGEYLGVMGSSGNSSGPHLHFEVYNTNGKLVDPYDGPCRLHLGSPTWKQQPPYFDSAVNRVQVGRNAPVLNACPNPDVPNDSGIVFRDGYGYFTTFYRDQRMGQLSTYRVIRPNGTVFAQWTHSIAVNFYPASWWYSSFWFPSGAPTGTWRFEVQYESQLYSTNFTVI